MPPAAVRGVVGAARHAGHSTGNPRRQTRAGCGGQRGSKWTLEQAGPYLCLHTPRVGSLSLSTHSHSLGGGSATDYPRPGGRPPPIILGTFGAKRKFSLKKGLVFRHHVYGLQPYRGEGVSGPESLLSQPSQSIWGEPQWSQRRTGESRKQTCKLGGRWGSLFSYRQKKATGGPTFNYSTGEGGLRASADRSVTTSGLSSQVMRGRG